MKLVIDVHYQNDDYAVASGILFSQWDSSSFERKVSVRVNEIKPYKPGSFFERELPCILALLGKIHEDLEIIVIDGSVSLGAEKKDGLGAHLYRAIGKKYQSSVSPRIASPVRQNRAKYYAAKVKIHCSLRVWGSIILRRKASFNQCVQSGKCYETLLTINRSCSKIPSHVI